MDAFKGSKEYIPLNLGKKDLLNLKGKIEEKN